jgi:DNA polymerase III epsilon subunit-like protein
MSDCFVAIDIETANQNRHSICQIGLVAFQGTEELWRWSTKVNQAGASRYGH